MNLARRIFIVTFVLLAAISTFGFLFWYNPKFIDPGKHLFSLAGNGYNDKNEVLSRLKLKAALAKSYIKEHRFNLSHCFLLDMKMPSGKNRFFVYDLKKDSVKIAGLVTHG